MFQIAGSSPTLNEKCFSLVMYISLGFSLPRLSNYGSLQNVTKGETSFISVDDGAENVMQSCSQSEAQEESTSIRVSQKRKVSILTSFSSLQMERYATFTHVNR